MARTFSYTRVSTGDQTVENQDREIAAAGFEIPLYRQAAETVSGGVPAMDRPGFAKLVEKMEPGDTLVVTKFDRLGRNAMDVQQTIAMLAEIPVRVHCLAIQGVDLTSPAGAFTMTVLGAVAQLERDLLVERTQSGLARARAQGKRIGRPLAVAEADHAAVLDAIRQGQSVTATASKFKTSRQTVNRIRARYATED